MNSSSDGHGPEDGSPDEGPGAGLSEVLAERHADFRSSQIQVYLVDIWTVCRGGRCCHLLCVREDLAIRLFGLSVVVNYP